MMLVVSIAPVLGYATTLSSLRPSRLFNDFDILTSMEPLSILTESMHQLTDLADRLADPARESSERRNRGIAEVAGSNGTVHHEITLRPKFDVKETKEGLIIVGSTPGLRKEDLTVEILDTPNGKMLEISGQTPASQSISLSSETSDAKEEQPKSDLSKTSETSITVPKLRSSYMRFERRTLLPSDIDPQSLHAKYQDGLLVVTLQRKIEKDHKSRVKYAIEG